MTIYWKQLSDLSKMSLLNLEKFKDLQSSSEVQLLTKFKLQDLYKLSLQLKLLLDKPDKMPTLLWLTSESALPVEAEAEEALQVVREKEVVLLELLLLKQLNLFMLFKQ